MAAAATRQNQNQNIQNPKEIRINLLKEFSGFQSQAGPFLQDVTLYLSLNQEVYNDDNKKIIFALSFMNSGPAQVWKESFITQKTNANGSINLGTWVACKQALENAFLISNIPGNAQAKLWTLKQTGRADEYIGQFWILAQWSKITDKTTLIEYFMEDLKPKLLEKIYSLQTIPTMIENWYSHACQFDNQ